MSAIIRTVALGVMVVAVIVHVVGFATNSWISSKLDTRGIENIMTANGLGSQPPGMTGMKINLGLWKYCLHMDLGSLGGKTDMCQAAKMKDVPGWMKAVQALGILSALTAVVGISAIIYSFIGDSKGDRARLMPQIIAIICLVAGVLLLVGVAVYGAEYTQMMQNQVSMMGTDNPDLAPLTKNLQENTGFGYSFILEAVSGVLMVLVSLLLLVAARISGSPHNMTV